MVNTNDSMAMNNLNGGPGGSQQQQAQKQREEDQKEKLKKMAEKGRVFAQQLRSMPEFAAVFKAMANLRLFTFMVVAWLMGVGVGLIFTFLFWHLQVRENREKRQCFVFRERLHLAETAANPRGFGN